MSGLDATIAQALELLADVGPIRTRKMFGGAGVFQDDVMFALIAFDEIYLKADDALAAALAAEGARQFVYEAKGKPMAMGYWTLPDAALDEPDAACAWARRALTVAHAAPKKKAR